MKKGTRRQEGCHLVYHLHLGIIAALSNHRLGWMRKRSCQIHYRHLLDLVILYLQGHRIHLLRPLKIDMITYVPHLLLHLLPLLRPQPKHTLDPNCRHHHQSRHQQTAISLVMDIVPHQLWVTQKNSGKGVAIVYHSNLHLHRRKRWISRH